MTASLFNRGLKPRFCLQKFYEDVNFLNMGILLAVGAMVFWGVGDFFIQKSAKKFGDWESFFGIAFIGSLIIFPFIYPDRKILYDLFYDNLYLLLAVAICFLLTSLVYFEALKKGKLSVVEPIGALELPIVGFLALLILKENLEIKTVFIITALIVGIILITLKPHHFSKQAWFEKGALLAILAAVLAGLGDFLISLSSRVASPLLTVWILNIFMTIFALGYLIINRKMGHFLSDLKRHKKIMVTVSLLDNLAWILFASAVVLMPMAITLALSEGYIALSSILGLIVNKEKLLFHQKGGLTIAVLSAIILATFI